MINKQQISPISQINIRVATIDDLDVLVNFSQSLALETEERKLDIVRLQNGIRTLIESTERGVYYVAVVNAIIVGQMMITYEWSDWRNGVFWWIQSVYVSPDNRRQGVYKSLHKHIVNSAKKNKDVCGIRLYVENNNKVAIKAYSNMGMKPTEYNIFEEDFIY